MKKVFLLAIAVLSSAVTGVFADDAAMRPGDTFDLRISGVPADDQTTISSNYTIDGQGFFNISYLGKLKVAGRTPSEIQTFVEQSYVEKKIFTHPTVTLTVANVTRFVNVGGQVKSPGRIPYTADMTVFTAINAAGDFTEFAKQSSVRLMRGNKVQIVNCKKIRADPSQDVKVLPGDSIQVEESIY